MSHTPAPNHADASRPQASAAQNSADQPQPPRRPPVALTVAGTDPSGGAGIHADLKAFTALGAYGTTVITALVAQNTHGVSRVYGIDTDFVADQFASVLGDMPVDASKTGMLANRELVEMVADRAASGKMGFLTVDPVMVATSGHRLIDEDAIEAVRSHMIPAADLITPNLPEAALLLGDEVQPAATSADMRAQARELLARGAGAVLLKGGHGEADTVTDVLAIAQSAGGPVITEFAHQRISSPNTHGTGCTLSAAITALLAKTLHGLSGEPLSNAHIETAVGESLDYLARALSSAADWELSYDMTGAHGPVDHMVDLPNA